MSRGIASHAERALCLLAVLFASPVDAQSAAPSIVAVPVVSGLDLPVYLTAPPGDTSRVFILELSSGRILILKGGDLLPQPFMVQTGVISGGERGLFSLAFHPEYSMNGYFFVSYAREGGMVVRRYRVSSNPDIADTRTGVDVIFFPTTSPIHFGGWIGFGPDGWLYIAKGETGYRALAAGDSTRLGKILRLDVTSAFPYAVPPGNPYASAPSPANEFWAVGFRNPWRCSFDRETGDFYIGDVGNRKWEEIDFQPAGSAGGENYGWPKLEGNEVFDCPEPCDTAGLSPPIAVFSHDADDYFCAIVGGYVYRGKAIADLAGTYFLADYCPIVGPTVFSFRVVNGEAVEPTDRTAEMEGGGVTIQQIVSFGEDASGELYICDLRAGIVSKIVSAASDPEAPTDAPIAPRFAAAPRPNPTLGEVTIEVERPPDTVIDARVFDVSGRLVRVLDPHSWLEAHGKLIWDSRDDRGDLVPTGVYFLRLGPGADSVRRITLIR